MPYKLPKVQFKNNEHIAFAKIYAKACCIVANSCYHDDSGVWYDTSKRLFLKNEHFSLIYQPKKGFNVYDTGDISMIIKKNQGKITKKYFQEIQYIIQYVDFLVSKSFNIILDITEQKWFEEFDSPDFVSLMEIVKPIHIKSDNMLSFNFTIRGFYSGLTHIDWDPPLIRLFMKDQLNEDAIEKIIKDIIENEEYIGCDKKSDYIDVQYLFPSLFQNKNKKRRLI